MHNFYIKRNDTKPLLTVTLSQDDSVVDITDATVMFHMGTITDATAVVVTATAGAVRYDWVAADTDVAGVYPAEFEVTFVDGKIETFPNTDVTDDDEFLTIIVGADLA